ncbi:MAG: hypothetical protein GX282_06950 [Campylobacteraceae bacterium]|nr:hypothetical protein [Campylobacteraceae bacterium]
MSSVKKLTITLPNNIMADLNDFSEELNETKSGIISQALEQFFDYLDLRVAKSRMEDNSQTLSLAEVRKLSNELQD